MLLLNDVLQIPVFAVPNYRYAVLGLAAAVCSVAWCNCGGGSFEPLRKAGVGNKCVQHALGAVICP